MIISNSFQWVPYSFGIFILLLYFCCLLCFLYRVSTMRSCCRDSKVAILLSIKVVSWDLHYKLPYTISNAIVCMTVTHLPSITHGRNIKREREGELCETFKSGEMSARQKNSCQKWVCVSYLALAAINSQSLPDTRSAKWQKQLRPKHTPQ